LIKITLFGANNEEFSLAGTELDRLKDEFSFELFQINTNQDRVVREKYQGKTPLLMIGPYTLQYPLKEQEIRVAMSAAEDRDRQLNLVSEEEYARRKSQGARLTTGDRIGYWLSRHFMFLFNTFLAVYVGLPFLAPALMKAGFETPARMIYTVYSPLCHQLAFRSWFLFGEQAYYPR